jgi:hypothetical protein
MNVEDLENLRNEYKIMKQKAENLDDFIKFNKLYNNITSKIYHQKNKDDLEYKQKKYNNLKKTISNNTEYYESIKEKNRIRNKNKYISKKDIKNNIYNNIENE